MEVDASMPYYPLGSRERHQLDEQLRLTRERELELERMRQLRQACTFQPEIELTTTDGLAWNNNNNTSSPSTSVFDRLQKQGEDVVRRRQERIAEKEMEDAERLAESFQPAINHRYAHNHQRVRALSEVPVEERLLHYGKCVAMTVERKREQQHREMEERSEHHQQHTSGDAIINKDRLHEFEARNAAFVQQREEKREAARRVAEEAISFQPTISPTSCALDQHRLERHDSAATRMGGTHPHASSISRGAMLYEQAMRSKHSRTTLPDDHGDGDDDVGAPRINPLSQQWIDHGPHQHLFQHNFVARQALYQQVSKEHRHMLREQQQSMEKMPTKRQTYSDGGANAIEASIQRLYYEAKQKRQDQQQQQQHARASSSSTCADGATFTPSLSPGTEQVLRHMRGRERDVVRRLTTPRGGAEVADEEPNKRERENLYARPSRPSSTATTRAACAQQSCGGDGGSSPRRRASSVEMSAFLQRQADALHQRQQHVREAQQQQAVQDVAQCTFTPRTNSTIRRPSTTNTTRDDDATGVARFVARQRAAQRLRAEQQERMEQLGRGKPINGPNYTIFTPFSFQDERTRGANLAEEHQAATMPTTPSEVVKENLPCGSVATPSRHVDVHVAADDVGARRTSSKKRSVSFAPTSYRSDRLMQQLRPTST